MSKEKATETQKSQEMKEKEVSNVESTSNDTSGLSINDLQVIKSIIDVACQRGAIKPNEMVAVGSTYTKLEQFLASVQQTDQQ